MSAHVLTIEDLQEFKKELFVELRKMLSEMNAMPESKWLKTYEVRKILRLSQGSLQNLRLQGTLPFTRLGGIIYYKAEDVNAMMQNLREVGPNSPFSLEKRSKGKLSN
jgi:hypothetical protein